MKRQEPDTTSKKFIVVGVIEELWNQNTGGHKVRHKFTSNIKPS